ncbi:MAG: hypothetical protein JW837_13360 [Sedimentisphaerales bacterium]|nr:hypothetical protein [Sedimentisphaerales bacterium]
METMKITCLVLKPIVYGGIFEPDSEQADEKGFRKDVLKAVQGSNIRFGRILSPL